MILSAGVAVFSRRHDAAAGTESEGLRLEEAADALGLPYEIQAEGRVSFRSSDVARLRAWLADRQAGRVAQAEARGSSGRRKTKRLSPYEQAKADQQRKDEDERVRRDSLAPISSPPAKGEAKTMPAPTTNSIDEFVRQHPRDMGFAGAVAVHAAINGEAAQKAPRPTSQATAKPQLSAKDEFRALVEAKLDSRLKAKQRFQPNARLGQADTFRAQQEVYTEHPGLRERMIAEANAGKVGFGMGRP